MTIIMSFSKISFALCLFLATTTIIYAEDSETKKTTLVVEDWVLPYGGPRALDAMVGDTIEFQWTGVHNVNIHPTMDCSFIGSIEVVGTTTTTTTNTTGTKANANATVTTENNGDRKNVSSASYTFTEEDGSPDGTTMYFASDVGQHCMNGQNLIVTVSSSTAATEDVIVIQEEEEEVTVSSSTAATEDVIVIQEEKEEEELISSSNNSSDNGTSSFNGTMRNYNNADIVLPEFPVHRFVPWSELDEITKNYAEQNLFYTEETWNNILTSSIERMTYAQIQAVLEAEDNNIEEVTSERLWAETYAALAHIALDDHTWDCWINHYTSNSWEELRDLHNVSWAFELMGWTEHTWQSDDESDWPDSELKFYEQLTDDQKLGADRICCPPEIWDGLSLTDWDFDDTTGVSEVQQRVELTRTNYPTMAPLPSVSSSVGVVIGTNVTIITVNTTVSESSDPVVIVDHNETDDIVDHNETADTNEWQEEVFDTIKEEVFENIEKEEEVQQQQQQQQQEPQLNRESSTISPTENPTDYVRQTESPTIEPTRMPSHSPSFSPTSTPSVTPSDFPSLGPTTAPSSSPSSRPTRSPSSSPSSRPTLSPSSSPSSSLYPSATPSDGPTQSSSPTASPSTTLSMAPSMTPSDLPSVGPTLSPSSGPSLRPTLSPSVVPTTAPSTTPSDVPSVQPSVTDSISPTVFVCQVNFTLVLLTDKYPVETSWTLQSISTYDIVGEGKGYQNEFMEHIEFACLSYNDCYTFTIRDKWDDGICCDNGPGSYAGFLQYQDPQSMDTMMESSRQDLGGGGASNTNNFVEVTSDEGDELVPIPDLNGGVFTDSAQHRFCLDPNGILTKILGRNSGVRGKPTTRNNNNTQFGG